MERARSKSSNWSHKYVISTKHHDRKFNYQLIISILKSFNELNMFYIVLLEEAAWLSGQGDGFACGCSRFKSHSDTFWTSCLGWSLSHSPHARSVNNQLVFLLSVGVFNWAVRESNLEKFTSHLLQNPSINKVFYFVYCFYLVLSFPFLLVIFFISEFPALPISFYKSNTKCKETLQSVINA